MADSETPTLRYIPSPAQAALACAVVEVEEHMSAQGWDGPVGVFALVRTAQAIAEDPQFAAIVDEESIAQSQRDPYALTLVEQEDLPPAQDLEDLLAHLAWPQAVDGVTLSVERTTLPPSAEEQAAAISDETERMAFLTAHPEREDVRIVVGVLRTGESWCAVRYRSHDSADSVIQGPQMVPGLIEALASTLQ